MHIVEIDQYRPAARMDHQTSLSYAQNDGSRLVRAACVDLVHLGELEGERQILFDARRHRGVVPCIHIAPHLEQKLLPVARHVARFLNRP